MNEQSRAPVRLIAGVIGIVVVGIATWLWMQESQAAVRGDVAKFNDTEIVAHPDVPLDPQKNVVWCGTMELAWNEAIAYLKRPLVFSQSNPLADLLNRQEFTKSDLDPDSYVVMSGRKIDQVDEKFRAELHRKFGESANQPQLDQGDEPPTAQDIAIYAYLQKNLVFATPFDTNVPLSFEGRKVASFGFGFESSPSSEARQELTSEVRLLDYKSKDDFVLELKAKSAGDQLILAKISPEKTLQETIDRVLPSLKSSSAWGLDEQDKLDIPKIDFDLTKHFKEFENQAISGGRLNTVAENVLFRLNEKGVELKTFTTITMTLGDSNLEPLQLIFDKPFLVLLKRESSPRPYFALWVGNPTLLVSR